MLIDFHTHTFPPHIARRAIEGMQANTHAQAFLDGTASDLTASMGRAGVTRSVVLPVATNPEKLQSMNAASIANNGKDGLVYFGAMHPQAENWLQELKALAAAGIRGIKLHPFYQNTDIDDIRTLRILEKAGELGLLTVIHAGDEIACPGQVRCSPEMTAKALRQVGDVPAVLAHMGGWKNWDRVAQSLGPTRCYLDTAISLGAIAPLDDGHYTAEALSLLTAEAFTALVRSFGAHRVLFGTDSPWADQQCEAEKISALPLTQEEKNAIFFENAQKLLGS